MLKRIFKLVFRLLGGALFIVVGMLAWGQFTIKDLPLAKNQDGCECLSKTKDLN